MRHTERETLLQALCTLAFALAERGHIWTPEQWAVYEEAIRVVEAEQPYGPLKLSINADGRVMATA